MKTLHCILLLSLASLVGCSGQPQPAEVTTITGAGSTFAQPIIWKWSEEYGKRNPGVRIVYDGVGSGGGEAKFLAEEVDFGGTDAGLKSDKLASVARGAVQVPITAGIIALAYNPEGLPEDLRLPRDVYADIFLGKGMKWSDERIQQANPGTELPDKDVAVVVRQDSSGTTFAFTNHLASVSQEWREKFKNPQASGDLDLGVKLVDWPGAAMQANGNSGVAGMIKRIPYSIGYVQYGAAREVDLPMAMLENKAGNFVQAAGTSGLETLLNAQLPPDLLGYFPDPEGEYSYPIVTFTWVLIFQEYPEESKTRQVKDFVRWCLTRGQDYSEAAGNVRLAPHVIRAAEKALESVGG
jgi:phosphate transport system substrate-binding protein